MRWLVAFLLAAFLSAPAARAQDQTVSVTIDRFVEFVDEDTVKASVAVTCSSGGVILEAFAYVVQTVGKTVHNSDFGFFHPTCDGASHTFQVTIQAAEGERFRRGRAHVSTLVLLESGASASPSQQVVIR